MVCHAVVRPIISSNFVPQIARPHLPFNFGLGFFILNFGKVGVYTLVKPIKGGCFVSVLVPLVLILSLNTCRVMDHPHRGICGVDVLTTGPGCSLSLNCNILWIYFEISWHLTHDQNNASTGMDSPLSFSFRLPLNFMHSSFVF